MKSPFRFSHAPFNARDLSLSNTYTHYKHKLFGLRTMGETGQILHKDRNKNQIGNSI